jgi:alkylation response protein AidB-like acyl-CoA dehydrogenase
MTTSDTSKQTRQETATAPATAVGAPGAAPKGGAFLLEPVVRPVFTREMFTDEQKEIERMVREFAAERILPVRDDLEKLDRDLSLQLLREVGELGLTAVDIPERYGGMELDKATSALVVEALTTCGSASWIVTFSAHVGIGTLPIVYFGTEEQKQRYLPKLGNMEYLGAYALTEPESGSDATNLKTTARLTEDGKEFVLNGTKMWITNGGWADLYVVFANLEGEGVTAFLIERGTEGLSTGAEEHKLGIKGSSTVALNLDDVHIPRESLLGEPGAGVPIALNVLNIGRFKLGAADLGGCKAVLDNATTYALERLQFGQPIAFFEAIRKKLADMVVRTYMLDSVIYRTVGVMDERISALDADAADYPRQVMAALEEYAIESSISKIFGSETMARIADHGVQIYGGYGFSEDYPMAGIYRDARIDRIFEGTNEINRMVIYGYFLRKALMEELPLRDAARGWDTQLPATGGPLEWEITSLDVARRLIIKCLFEAISLYGQDLRNAQVVGEDLADLVIGYFAASGSINRILQLPQEERATSAYRALGRLIVATFLEEAVRLIYRLRPTLFGGGYGQKALPTLDLELQRLQLPFDPVQEVQILTDDLYARGAYRF